MLRNGSLKDPRNSLGYLTCHFTVDDRSIYQSLPVNEQGQHADYEGRGNRESIGIEMCENRGGSRAATVERTA
jgi:N-acetylmuramoyl-L-alanine amidase